MPQYELIWDDSDDGNIAHLDAHGVSPEEAAYVVEHPLGHAQNRKGDPVAFGYTLAGRHLAVAYWFVDEHKNHGVH